MLSTDVGQKQVIKSHQNATPGTQEPYFTYQFGTAKPLHGRPTIKRANGHRYRAQMWEIGVMLECFRGDPLELLSKCQQGLFKHRKEAFTSNGITPRLEGDILMSPEARGEFWEAHGQMRLILRVGDIEQEDIQTLEGVRFKLTVNNGLVSNQLITE
jgi:hypothetical protein